MHAHLVMGPEVVVGAVHAKLAEDVYQDENVLTFMLHSLDRLRKEILSRRLVYA
jgi:chromate reductase